MIRGAMDTSYSYIILRRGPRPQVFGWLCCPSQACAIHAMAQARSNPALQVPALRASVCSSCFAPQHQ